MLRQLGTNKVEIKTVTGNIVLFSYDTPVAARLNGERGFIRTNKHYSRTTTKHINQWLGGAKAAEVPQETIYRLLGGASCV